MWLLEEVGAYRRSSRWSLYSLFSPLCDLLHAKSRGSPCLKQNQEVSVHPNARTFQKYGCSTRGRSVAIQMGGTALWCSVLTLPHGLGEEKVLKARPCLKNLVSCTRELGMFYFQQNCIFTFTPGPRRFLIWSSRCFVCVAPQPPLALGSAIVSPISCPILHLRADRITWLPHPKTASGAQSCDSGARVSEAPWKQAHEAEVR